jgi:hypothetical protein
MTDELEEQTQDYLAHAQALCEQAQKLIQQEDAGVAQIAGVLRQCLDALPTPPTEEAQEFWGIAAKQWRLLVFRVGELERAEAYLREGVGRFADYEGVEILRRMRTIAQSVLAVQEALSLPQGGSWPFWFEERGAAARLSDLVESLDQLPDEYTWPVLERHALSLRGTLFEGHLPKFLNWLLESARQQAQERDYAHARQTIVTALSFVSDAYLTDLPETVKREEMLALKDAIDARQGSEVSMWVQLVQLTNQEISFNAALQEITLDLPDHPDVWVSDLEDLYSDLIQAAEVEAFIEALTASEKVFFEASHWNQFNQLAFNIQEEVPEFLVRNDPRLAVELQKRFDELLERVNHLPVEMVQRLESSLEEQEAGEPVRAGSKLVHRYWQVVWCLENGILIEPHIREAAHRSLKQVHESLQTLALSAAESFEGMVSQDDLIKVVDLVSRLRELNLNLARYPESGQAGLLEEFAEGVVLPQIDPTFPKVALKLWERILLSWVDASAAEPPDQHVSSESKAADMLQEVGAGIDRLLSDLSALEKEVYPSIGLPPWEPGTTPAIMEAEGERINDLIESLEKLDVRIEESPPMEAAVLLNEHLERFDFLYAPEGVWILIPYRSILLVRVEFLYQQVKTSVAEQISSILDHPQSAPDRLRSEILEKDAPPEISELVHQDIQTYISHQQAAAEDDQWQHTLPLWDAVRRATQPWSGGEAAVGGISLATAESWRQLHRLARREYRKGWVLSRRRGIGIGFGVLVLLIVVGFGARAIMGGIAGGARPTLVAAVPSVTRAHPDTPQPSAGSVEVETTSTPDESSQAKTATVQAEATQEALAALAGTSTAQAGATAMAKASQATATAEAAVCVDPSDYGFTILGEAQLSPERGSYYVSGTTPYPVSVAWDIQNTGVCGWEELAVDLSGGEEDFDVEFQRQGSAEPVSPEEPVHIDEVVRVVVRLDVQDLLDLSSREWVLAANGISLINSPLLSFDPQDWILFVTPPVSRP